jgi:hypothetical protein
MDGKVYCFCWQPSSSSRTAELLEKSGGGTFSFLAASAEAQKEFGGGLHQGDGGGGSGGQVNTLILTNVIMEDDLPPEIRMVFRKLQKKDGITKIKVCGRVLGVLGRK